MKRGIIIFLSIFLISLATAVPTLTLQHNEIQPGETIFGTIQTTGEFTEGITKEDIKFFEGRKQVFFENDLIFSNGTYYFYAYTTREGNFTLKVLDILYKENETLQSAGIVKDLIIKEKLITGGNESGIQILSIKPGFIGPTSNLELTLTNKGNLSFEVDCLENKTSLAPLVTEKVVLPESQDFIICSAYEDFEIPVLRNPQGEIIVPPITSSDLRTDLSILSTIFNAILSSFFLNFYFHKHINPNCG